MKYVNLFKILTLTLVITLQFTISMRSHKHKHRGPVNKNFYKIYSQIFFFKIKKF
jgi:hypothetical protein